MKNNSPASSQHLSNDKHDLLKRLKHALEIIAYNPDESLLIIQTALKNHSNNAWVWVTSARINEKLGKFYDAERALEQALALDPKMSEAVYAKANHLYQRERFEEAEVYLKDIIPAFNENEARPLKGLFATVLQKQKKYQQAIENYLELIERDENNWLHWNNLGMIYQDLAQFDKMEEAFIRSASATSINPTAHFNHIVGMHYDPHALPEHILELCKKWQAKFKPDHKVIRAKASDLTKNKTIRIGMISDGFRSHPVGNMITLGLSHIPKEQMEIFAYSTNFHEDHITYRIKDIVKKWQVIDGLSDDIVNDLIRTDEIDILFDLCGYNSNSRMLTFLKQPAPIQVKWVGGLISSTGLEGMDYLLSDFIETPEGVDDNFTEKLIRMPGDYICYDPPHYLPPVKNGPVNDNGYITFGCFNNAAKINDVLLVQWAELLNRVPNSRLFLKSFNFKNDMLCERVWNTLEQHGVARERVLLEGSSPHKELLDCYNRVDIALDPWPYSGGLTTCEAMAMGVPVVTLPGPTFAGRHSASHLVNAGMPELVAESWEQYVNISVVLADDINSLSVIRQHLRDILLASPVCDGQRFAQHFSDAMRAIWQRYCEGKQPEALNLSEEGAPYFLDDKQAVMLEHPEKSEYISNSVKIRDFEFQLDGKVIMVDYGGNFVRSDKFINLTSIGATHTIIIDPLSTVEDKNFPLDRKHIQHIKAHLLSNGDDKQYYMCLDARYSSDLVALESAQAGDSWIAQRVLTEVTFPSSKLDEIHGLDRLEWFSVDNSLDLKTTFAHGQRVLTSCLFINVQYRFEHSHHGQLTFSQLEEKLSALGFRFHAFADVEYAAPVMVNEQNTLASSQMVAAQLLFLPTAQRLQQLTFEQREKLAFILHAGYQMRDAAYHVLQVSSVERAQAYLENE